MDRAATYELGGLISNPAL